MKKYLYAALFVLITAFLIIPCEGRAASKKKKAMKAYNKLLSQSEINYYDWDGRRITETDDNDKEYLVTLRSSGLEFTTAYIDNDSVPELIFYGDFETGTEGPLYPNAQVYTRRNGKLQYLGGLSLYSMSKSGYYKKKGIIEDYAYNDNSHHDINYYRIKGKTLKRLSIYKSYPSRKKVHYLKWPEKRISHKKFNKKLRKYIGKARLKHFKWHKNTPKNRKKYLK